MGWEELDRSRRMATIDEKFPYNGFHNRTNNLTRHQASLMVQLRSRHIPLNVYLCRIGKSEMEHIRLARMKKYHCKDVYEKQSTTTYSNAQPTMRKENSS
jgi:hypothetical protein